MKIAGAILIALTMATAYGEIVNTNTSTTSGSTMTSQRGTVNGSTNNSSGADTNRSDVNRPTFGNAVPNTGTTTGNVRDNTIGTDSVNSSQSSTVPATNSGCTDRNGGTFTQNDSGFSSCINSTGSRRTR